VFPNFVAEGRRAELADGVRRCDGLYRQYYRGLGDTLPEARCHVLLSSMGVDDEEDADDHPTGGEDPRPAPGYVYRGVTMKARPIGRYRTIWRGCTSCRPGSGILGRI